MKLDLFLDIGKWLAIIVLITAFPLGLGYRSMIDQYPDPATNPFSDWIRLCLAVGIIGFVFALIPSIWDVAEALIQTGHAWRQFWEDFRRSEWPPRVIMAIGAAITIPSAMVPVPLEPINWSWLMLGLMFAGAGIFFFGFWHSKPMRRLRQQEHLAQNLKQRDWGDSQL